MPVVPPIPPLPDVTDCDLGPVPIMPQPIFNVPPVGGAHGADGVDGCDGLDGKDGVDGIDGQDGQDGQDGCDGLDGRDGVDGIDGQDGQDGQDGCDGLDGRDGIDGQDAADGKDGIANFYDTAFASNYTQGETTAYIRDSLGNVHPVRVPYPQSQCDVLAGTPARFYIDLERSWPVLDTLGRPVDTNYVLLDTGQQCGGGGGTIVMPPSGGLTCKVIEPVRSPRFYDPTITPNPMALDPEGFFLPKEIAAVANCVNAFMSMGLVSVIGKEYSPLPATYVGGEITDTEGYEEVVRERGEIRLNADGNPLYLMRRELKVADNFCTIRRGRDTSFPFKWRYVNGVDFSSGIADFLASDKTYTEFIYSHAAANDGGGLSDDNASTATDTETNEFGGIGVPEMADYFEMKPFYAYSSVAYGNEDDADAASGTVEEFIGVSPQWWSLTEKPEEAQLNYDFAYCPNLEWAEALVPGETVECVERTVLYKVLAADEYGQPIFKYVRDPEGNILTDIDGLPILELDENGHPIREEKFKAFRYYELVPPEIYEVPTNGQPSVELYIGTEGVIQLGDGMDGEFVASIPTTLLQVSRRYIRPEDIVTPNFEQVYVRLRQTRDSAEIVNPLAVVSDLQTDRNGHLTRRLRALFYKRDDQHRRYPMLFEVSVLPHGYCIETGNIKQYYSTDYDECAPHYLEERYYVRRVPRKQGEKGQTLQLAMTKCFKHRLQVPVLVRDA